MQPPASRRWFYLGAGVGAVLLSVAGFGPSLVDHSRRFAPPTALVIAHAFTAAAWLALYLTQATLAATGRMAIHRRLGWLGPAIAAAVLVLGFFTSIEVTRRVSDLSGDVTRLMVPAGSPPLTEEENLLGIWGPLGVLLNFGLLVTVALLFRHRPEVHKRVMVFALMPLAFEALLHLGGTLVGRVPAPPGAILGAVVLTSTLLYALVGIHDRLTTGRVHPASVWVPVAMIGWGVLSTGVLFRTEAALRLARWLVG